MFPLNPSRPFPSLVTLRRYQPFIVAFFSVSLWAQTPINNVTGLQAMSRGSYVLMANLNLTGENWTPIGSQTQPFSGVFNGNWHIISGLYVNKTGLGGLFGKVTGSWIGNLTLLEPQVITTGANYPAGALAGSISGSTVANVINIRGEIRSNGEAKYTGGIVGEASRGSRIERATNTGTVSTSANYAVAGGVVGYQRSSSTTVSNSLNTGAVSTSGKGADAGGVVGYQRSSSTVSNSLNTGPVSTSTSATSADAGGVVGSQGASTVSNSLNTGAVSSSGANAGGVVGRQVYSSTVSNSLNTGPVSTSGTFTAAGGVVGHQGDSTVSNSLNTGAVSTNGRWANAGGVVGRQLAYLLSKGTVSNSFYDSEQTGVSGGNSTAELKQASTYSSGFESWRIVQGKYPFPQAVDGLYLQARVNATVPLDCNEYACLKVVVDVVFQQYDPGTETLFVVSMDHTPFRNRNLILKCYQDMQQTCAKTFIPPSEIESLASDPIVTTGHYQKTNNAQFIYLAAHADQRQFILRINAGGAVDSYKAEKILTNKTAPLINHLADSGSNLLFTGFADVTEIAGFYSWPGTISTVTSGFSGSAGYYIHQGNQNVYVAGSQGSSAILQKYNLPNLTLDMTFGINGTIAEAFSVSARGTSLQTDNQHIYLAGNLEETEHSASDLFINRYTLSGEKDSDFNLIIDTGIDLGGNSLNHPASVLLTGNYLHVFKHNGQDVFFATCDDSGELLSSEIWNTELSELAHSEFSVFGGRLYLSGKNIYGNVITASRPIQQYFPTDSTSISMPSSTPTFTSISMLNSTPTFMSSPIPSSTPTFTSISMTGSTLTFTSSSIPSSTPSSTTPLSNSINRWPWWAKMIFGTGLSIAGTVTVGTLLCLAKHAYNRYMHSDKPDMVDRLYDRLKRNSQRKRNHRPPMPAPRSLISLRLGPDGGSTLAVEPAYVQPDGKEQNLPPYMEVMPPVLQQPTAQKVHLYEDMPQEPQQPAAQKVDLYDVIDPNTGTSRPVQKPQQDELQEN